MSVLYKIIGLGFSFGWEVRLGLVGIVINVEHIVNLYCSVAPHICHTIYCLLWFIKLCIHVDDNFDQDGLVLNVFCKC